ncbi:MAG: hypothetical protein KAT77_06170 [Nanoarchaeota archaeon]|nr:hypothetical protein [Nanoarchaeota archaeon]
MNKILGEIGLTKTEIKIYLTLLKLGQSTTTNIIKKAGIHASKVYEFLDRLIQKGLVSYVIKANKKYFQATEPEALIEFIKEKRRKLDGQEKEIKGLLPELAELQKEAKKERVEANIYEGLKGIKSVYEKILKTLKPGQRQYIIGAPRIANEKVEGFLLDWHKRRIKKGIKCKYIYDANVKDYGKIREKMKFTEVKYLPPKMISPVWIEIFEDHIATGYISKETTMFFLIKNKEIAKTYLDYFSLMWKIAKK